MCMFLFVLGWPAELADLANRLPLWKVSEPETRGQLPHSWAGREVHRQKVKTKNFVNQNRVTVTFFVLQIEAMTHVMMELIALATKKAHRAKCTKMFRAAQ